MACALATFRLIQPISTQNSKKPISRNTFFARVFCAPSRGDFANHDEALGKREPRKLAQFIFQPGNVLRGDPVGLLAGQEIRDCCFEQLAFGLFCDDLPVRGCFETVLQFAGFAFCGLAIAGVRRLPV